MNTVGTFGDFSMASTALIRLDDSLPTEKSQVSE
jgi:hypothetical protein